MFSKFFIDRPRFAVVIAIVMALAGVVSVISMPIGMYPEIAPPEIMVQTQYPGASAETVANNVGIPLEKAINGIENMLYMSSSSYNSGAYQLSVVFETGTDPDLDQVKVQNRIQQVVATLPKEVQDIGVTVRRRSSDILAFMQVTSPNGTYDSNFLNNYVENNIKVSLGRAYGVGEVNVLGAATSMRVWIDADKVTALNIPISTIKAAIQSQNVQPSLGSVGSAPGDGNQVLVYSLETQGRLNDPKDFENIIVRTAEEGGLVRLKDIARVELGSESYLFNSTVDGRPSVAMIINKSSGANAVNAMKAVRAELQKLERFYPEDFEVKIFVDTTDFILASIEEVFFTLFLTFILVVIVCYVFLQDWRATLVPSIAIPVSILATFAVMKALGFNLNILTLFGLVLAIGLVVDDAIVVVERTLFLMQSENLNSKQAATKAMEQVSSAVVATTLVLLAIFVPIAFMGGITGKIYQQFAIAISFAVTFSSINALTLSPALSATFLRPFQPSDKGFLGAFNRFIKGATNKYLVAVGYLGRKIAVIVFILGALLLANAFFLKFTATSFLPDEDQGVIMINVQLPEGASNVRTKAVNKKILEATKDHPAVKSVMNLDGFSIMAGQGENVGFGVLALKNWKERKDPKLYSTTVKNELSAITDTFSEAKITMFELPALPGLGATNAMDMKIQSVENTDPRELEKVINAFTMQAFGLPQIMLAYSTYNAKTPHAYIEIDREKAESLGVAVGSIYSALQTYVGSSYISDINIGTQVNKVKIQADWKYRRDLDSLNNIYVSSSKGAMVPLGSLIKISTVLLPRGIERYNQYPSATVNALAAPGFSSGEAMQALEDLAIKTLPKGYTYAWSGSSLQEKNNQGQIFYIIAFAILFAYLFMVAQYESWMIPLSVMLSVTAAMLGALIGLFITKMSLSIYAQLGLVLLVGLAAKNAILIVEFARDAHTQGHSIMQAALYGTRERFRAVLMTAFTFILGVAPLVWATGASAGSRVAVGVPVFTGMIIGTFSGLVLIPLMYILIQTITDYKFKDKNAQSANNQR
ncbi:MAG: efflux RND transporter permease subunit [Alphaproteobacteria bacterium]|nr:efflux RND transporter permease subunit [Alphaproteobacteria bacterium]